jgi:hypothetical protein
LTVNCGASDWSEVIFFSTPKNLTAFLEVQGTGQYNPLDTYVNLNGSYLFKGQIDGLLMTVINRCDLKMVFQQVFDTRNDPLQAGLLSEKLRSFDSNFLVILVSGGAWEPFFTKELSDAIWELGGYLTLTQTRVVPFQPSYFFDVVYDTGRPYAFLAVPGQKNVTGMNFEVLRNLTKYFNYNDSVHNAIPTARIRVNLVFDTFRQFFMLDGKRVFRPNQI